MQQSNIYKLIKKFPYPFIVRHDRQSVYYQNPDLDYSELWRYSVRISIFGYIVGKFIKMPWIMAILSPIPIVIKFIYQQYKLKEKGKFQEVYRFENSQLKKKMSQIKQKEKQKEVSQRKNILNQKQVSLKENYPGQGIVSVKQYVKRLPKQYYL